MRDALEHESGIVRKPKAAVEPWIANEHTPSCSDIAQFGKASLHQRPSDATALQIGFDRNWAKSIPARNTIIDAYWGKRDMPHDAAGIFGDQRDRKRMICSQSADDELLGLMTVRMREKSTSSNLLNCIFV